MPFGQDSSLWFQTIIIRQQHHSQSGQTRWSWSESNWIAVRFELKSLWKVQTFLPNTGGYDGWTGEGTTSTGQRSSKQIESGKHMKAVTFPSCCQREHTTEWTLPADVQDTEQAPRSETSLPTGQPVLVSLTHTNTYLSHFSMKKWNSSGSKALLWLWQKDFWHSLACMSYRRSLELLRRIKRFAIRRPGFQRNLLLYLGKSSETFKLVWDNDETTTPPLLLSSEVEDHVKSARSTLPFNDGFYFKPCMRSLSWWSLTDSLMILLLTSQPSVESEIDCNCSSKRYIHLLNSSCRFKHRQNILLH